MSIDACDTKISMLLSLLLANVRIYQAFSFCFLFYLVIFLTIPVVRKKNRVRLALVIPSGATTILVNEIIDTPPLDALKTIKSWSI